MLKPATPATTSAEPSFSETLTKSMNTQMKYVFPFLIALIAYRSGVVALYLITSTIFTVLQQIYIGRKRHLKLVLE
jgi:membrane protein insertase Oxa1/YidC/SpoIIIJ